MKRLLLAICLFPLSAYAVDVKDLKVVRARDGVAARCVASPELNKPTYLLLHPEASASDSALRLSFDVDFVICVKNGNGFEFAARKPLDAYSFNDSEYGQIRVESKDPMFYVLKDSFHRLMESAAQNESSQRIAFSVPFDKLLSPAQRRSLDLGEEVKLRLEVVSSAIRVFTVGGETKPAGRRSDGRFSFFLTIQK